MVEDCQQQRPSMARRMAAMIPRIGVQDPSVSAFTIDWIERSRSNGTGVHNPPVYATGLPCRLTTICTEAADEPVFHTYPEPISFSQRKLEDSALSAGLIRIKSGATSRMLPLDEAGQLSKDAL